MAYEEAYDLGLLLPAKMDWNRTHIRYGGLVSELLQRDLSVVLLEGQSSYIGDAIFEAGRTPVEASLGNMSTAALDEQAGTIVVRDLTMPKDSTKLYEDPNAPVIVHPPEVNAFFRSKSNVYDLMPSVQPFTITRVENRDVSEAIAGVPGPNIVVKPDTGAASEGVLIGAKADIVKQFTEAGNNAGLFVVQEAIDMSHGLPEHDITGAHNLRFIVIGGTAIFGFIRDDGGSSLTLAGEGDTFVGRKFKLPEDYSEGFQSMLLQAQQALTGLQGSDRTVLAIDLMRGINAAGEEREYVLEINRRPLRNSPYDDKNPGTMWAARKWDAAEADMLHGIISEAKK